MEKRRFYCYQIFAFLAVFFVAAFAGGLVFMDFSSAGFNNGTYLNTSYNGSSVILFGSNLTGSFSSRIFDAGAAALWENMSWQGRVPVKDFLLAVDASGAVYSSINFGVNWSIKTSDYGGGSATDMFADNNYSYIVYSGAHEVYRSGDLGASWQIVNDSFTTSSILFAGADYNRNLFVVAGPGTIFRSNNSGVSWINAGDFNGASSSSAKGIAINSSNAFYVVDNNGVVYVSVNGGVSWTTQNSSYGGGVGTDDMAADRGRNLYILFNKQIYRSNNSGVSWQIVNDSFTSYSNDGWTIVTDSNDSLYIIDGGDRVFRSNNSGVSWTELSDFNGASLSNIRGFTSATRATNLSFQVRNCTSANCADGTFKGLDGTSNSFFDSYSTFLNLTGRYFQYKFYFSRPDLSFTSSLDSVTIGYNILDNTPPLVNLISPMNSSYAGNSVFLNYSVSDDTAVESCWYSIDGLSNISLDSPSVCSTANILSLTDGGHILRVYANDTAGNINYSSVSFFSDATPPQLSGFQFFAPDIYSNALSFFNVTWTDVSGIGQVLFESNFSGTSMNYTMYSVGGGIYRFNASISAGTFYWKSYANDSYGNLNSSSVQTFTIDKAGNPISLYINGNRNQNVSVSYGTQTNVTGNAFGEISLFRDGLAVANPEISVLGANSLGYVYFLNATGSENYTSNFSIFYLFISKSAPNLNVLVNNFSGDFSGGYGSETNISAFENVNGDADASYNLTRNGELIGVGSSVFDSDIFGTGVYEYNYSSSGGENYSAGSLSRTITIIKGMPIISLFIDGMEGNRSKFYGNESNISAVIDIQGLQLELLRNGNQVAMGLDFAGENLILAAGKYSYTAIFEGNENYTGVNKSYSLEINKSEPSFNLLLNGADSDLSLPVFNVLEVNLSSVLPQTSLDLYENSNFSGSGSNIFVTKNYTSLGNRVWIGVIHETENYTAKNFSHTVSVIDSSVPQFSNLTVSPSSPTSYSPGKDYRFNIVWVDNLGISDVIISFNGINYSLSSGVESHENNIYSFSVSNLAVGGYSYRWFANDTSGNVSATQTQFYNITKGIAVLGWTVSPSSSVSYGAQTSVRCTPNNAESIPFLTRGADSVSNPDVSVLGVGPYSYACTSSETQNYTFGSSSAGLIINKASPIINLSLNGFNSDVSLSASGEEVNMTAFLVSPTQGAISLLIDNVLVGMSNGSLQNSSFFSVVGSHPITAVFGGNENYTSGSVTLYVFVSEPAPASSGSGSGGGGGGVFPSNSTRSLIKDLKVDIAKPEVFSIKRGTSSDFELSVTNAERVFLNDCQLEIGGMFSSWVHNGQVKGISSGEKYKFGLNVKVPGDVEPGEYPGSIAVKCDEGKKEISLSLVIFRNNFEASIGEYEKEIDRLRVNYSLEEFAKERHSVKLNYELVNANGESVAEGEETFNLNAGEKVERSLEVRISKDITGEYVLKMIFDDGKVNSEIDKQVILPSAGILGLAISENNMKTLSLFGLVVLSFIGVYFLSRFVIRKYNLKKIGKNLEGKRGKGLIKLEIKTKHNPQ